MEINFNKKNNTEASIKVRLNKSDYQPQVEKKIKEYSKKMNLKGFRPGKVPTGVVKKMYGKSILVEEVNHILSHKVNDYIKENEIKILGEPLPDKETTSMINWDNPDDLEFDYNLGLVDEFEMKLSKKNKVKKYVIKVDKGALEDTLKDIRQRFGTEEEGEDAQEGDVLEINVAEAAGELIKEEVSLPLSKLDKKVAKKFFGSKKGDTIEMPIEKLTEDENLRITLTGVSPEEASTLKGKYTYTINGIKRTLEAEHNQELYDKVFGAGVVSNEEEYLKKVEETISGNYDRESENFLGLSIRNYLIEKIKIDLPEPFLKEWLKVTDTNITDEDLDREFEGYVESLKWNLIQNRISTDQEIKVEHEDVREEAKKMITEQFGGQLAVESIKDQLDSIADNYLQGENGKHYQQIHDNLRGAKVLDAIRELIGIDEKKVSVEEFTKIVQEGN